jgi:8-oxo-dGTP diphosphatase
MTDIRHYTASAIVFDEPHQNVLLIHHNKVGLWLYPGGHIDPNEDPAQAALREVNEETGIHAHVISTPAFVHAAVDSHPAPWVIVEMTVTDSKVGQHRHIDHVYVCRASADAGLPTAQLDEVAGAHWVPLDGIVGLPTPAELPELIATAARWAKAQ